MNVDQIERRVELATDRIDAKYMAGALTTEQYEERMRELEQWANAQYDALTERV